jgi:hypothetical protein
MNISCPTLNIHQEASASVLTDALCSLKGSEDPYLILSKTDMTYMQTVWTENGFILEYQEESIAHHYVASDTLTLDEVTNTFMSYLNGSSQWKASIKFENKNIASTSWSLGHYLGKVFGGLFRAFKKS